MYRYTTIKAAEIDINLYPNHAINVITADCDWFTSRTTATLYDATGRYLLVTLSKGANTYTFDINTLPAGLYWISFSSDGIQVNKKFVKTY